jgi:2-oxoglutarate dehydrogenase E2 component (dihydrolipoamide succinyltransferase)
MITVTMPEMGESVVEGTVEKWLVRAGDRVEKDQVLCEVTTDKVDAEIPAPAAGVVAQILVEVGSTVQVGAKLVSIDETASAGAGAPSAASARSAESAASARSTESAASARSTESAPARPQLTALERPAPASAPLRATPLAKRVAQERGVNLEQVVASGSGGRVTRSDVLEAGERGAAPLLTAEPGTLGEFLSRMRVPRYTPREEDKVIPFSAIRRRIAEHMVVSKIVSPHVGTVAEVDLHQLVSLREKHKNGFKKAHGFNLTYLPFVVYAAVRALREIPRMNSSVVDQQIIERGGIHIGVAVETERGLVVPVLRDADQYTVGGLARGIEDLAARARDRELGADDLQGGTFTITNPGKQGNLYGFAVINQPQVGILRMGEVKKRAVVVERDGEDSIVIRPMMYLSLSYDHRVIDGVTGNSFLFQVARHLESERFEL